MKRKECIRLSENAWQAYLKERTEIGWNKFVAICNAILKVYEAEKEDENPLDLL